VQDNVLFLKRLQINIKSVKYNSKTHIFVLMLTTILWPGNILLFYRRGTWGSEELKKKSLPEVTTYMYSFPFIEPLDLKDYVIVVQLSIPNLNIWGLSSSKSEAIWVLTWFQIRGTLKILYEITFRLYLFRYTGNVNEFCI
jgi:hypothetical protein